MTPATIAPASTTKVKSRPQILHCRFVLLLLWFVTTSAMTRFCSIVNSRVWYSSGTLFAQRFPSGTKSPASSSLSTITAANIGKKGVVIHLNPILSCAIIIHATIVDRSESVVRFLVRRYFFQIGVRRPFYWCYLLLRERVFLFSSSSRTCSSLLPVVGSLSLDEFLLLVLVVDGVAGNATWATDGENLLSWSSFVSNVREEVGGDDFMPILLVVVRGDEFFSSLLLVVSWQLIVRAVAALDWDNRSVELDSSSDLHFHLLLFPTDHHCQVHHDVQPWWCSERGASKVVAL